MIDQHESRDQVLNELQDVNQGRHGVPLPMKPPAKPVAKPVAKISVPPPAKASASKQGSILSTSERRQAARHATKVNETNAYVSSLEQMTKAVTTSVTSADPNLMVVLNANQAQMHTMMSAMTRQQVLMSCISSNRSVDEIQQLMALATLPPPPPPAVAAAVVNPPPPAKPAANVVEDLEISQELFDEIQN